MDCITISGEHGIKFPKFCKKKGNILILGNYIGVAGNPNAETAADLGNNDSSWDNLGEIKDALKSKHKVYVIGDESTIEYFTGLINYLTDCGVFESDAEYKFRNTFKFRRNHSTRDKCFIPIVSDFSNFDDIYNNLKEQNMKFANIIQNPPYDGSLHLDFLEKGLDLLDENGRMVIIQPATWLINLRDTGMSKRTKLIKAKLEHHVESVTIENLNKEFNTSQYVPFATTVIDMSKRFDYIDFKCFGEYKKVSSLNDCNLIGNYATIKSIFKKVMSFGNMMKMHIFNPQKMDSDGLYFVKYPEMFSGSGSKLCGISSPTHGASLDSSNVFQKTKNGEFLTPFVTGGYHYNQNGISNTIPMAVNSANKETGEYADCLYGTYEELSNWVYFNFNNKLSTFINICMTNNQRNMSISYLPWLVDKQYTDDEINALFGFSADEIRLIDFTLKKFERTSKWFLRYVMGPDYVKDSDVNNFIQEINE